MIVTVVTLATLRVRGAFRYSHSRTIKHGQDIVNCFFFFFFFLSAPGVHTSRSAIRTPLILWSVLVLQTVNDTGTSESSVCTRYIISSFSSLCTNQRSIFHRIVFPVIKLTPNVFVLYFISGILNTDTDRRNTLSVILRTVGGFFIALDHVFWTL